MASKTTTKSKSPRPARPTPKPAAGKKAPVVRPAVSAPKPYKPARPAAAPEAVALTEEQLQKCKSGLNKRDLTKFRELLLQKRAQILGDVDSLQTDQRNKNGGGNLSNMPLHMADVGTDNYDQEFNLSLLESERKLLREIHEALSRMDKGYYGVCVDSGKPIGKPRLEAKPWAKFCIEVAREKERRGETIL